MSRATASWYSRTMSSTTCSMGATLSIKETPWPALQMSRQRLVSRLRHAVGQGGADEVRMSTRHLVGVHDVFVRAVDHQVLVGVDSATLGGGDEAGAHVGELGA